MERDTFLYKARRSLQAAAHKLLPDSFLSKLYSRIVIGKWPDLDDPRTFNEKIQWMKLYYYPNDPNVIRATDKLAAREFAAEKGAVSPAPRVLGIWDRADKIDWDELPEAFMLKCNHGCAYNIAVKDKNAADKKKISKQLDRWLGEDFGAFNVELHYSKIMDRRIFCEEYLGDCIEDYKFFCFNGKPQFVYVSSDLIHDRQAKMGFFRLNGEKMQMRRDDYEDIGSIELPPFYDAMLADAAKL